MIGVRGVVVEENYVCMVIVYRGLMILFFSFFSGCYVNMFDVEIVYFIFYS